MFYKVKYCSVNIIPMSLKVQRTSIACQQRWEQSWLHTKAWSWESYNQCDVKSNVTVQNSFLATSNKSFYFFLWYLILLFNPVNSIKLFHRLQKPIMHVSRKYIVIIYLQFLCGIFPNTKLRLVYYKSKTKL